MAFTFSDLFKRNKQIEKDTNEFWDYFWDLEFVSDKSERAYLKKMAIDRVLNFVARSVSQSEFKYTNNGKDIKNAWSYKLNVVPNSDNNANDFWQKVTYKLLFDNEILIILSDDNQLLIADDFVRTEYALYPDKFDDVTVKDYTFERTFSRDEVIYIEYNNDKLEKIVTGLFSDYGELFGRMIEVSLRNNQIRATVSVDGNNNAFDEKVQTGLQNFVSKMYKAFSNSSVAIVPKVKGFDYEEHSKGAVNNSQSVDELKKLKKDLVNDVAGAIGVPPSLVHGEMADLDSAIELYFKFCLAPLLNKISSELNRSLITESDYLNGDRIEIIGINQPDIFDLATNIDKLVSSGTFNRNEIRKKVGYDEAEGLSEFVITKNYTDLKGGEEE